MLVALGFLVLGAVAGFAWEMDRQLRGGILRQYAEARQRPDWISIEEIPAPLTRVVVEAVDPTFFVRRPLSGAPEDVTIARDIVRQIHLLEPGIPSEAREMVLAPLLEMRLSRRELLELYLNRVYLGRSGGMAVFGVADAAREYFGKEPRELSTSELATLTGLLLEPRIRNPNGSPGAVGVRRNEVLRNMVQERLIDAGEFQSAVREALAFQPGLEDQPMTRPPGWEEPIEPLRLPAPDRPDPESSP